MGNALQLSCCEGSCENVDIQKIDCTWRCCCQEEKVHQPQVVYMATNGPRHMNMIQGDYIHLKEPIKVLDVPLTTTTVCFKDHQGAIRVLTHQDPDDIELRIQLPEVKEDVSGRLLRDIIAVDMYRPLEKIIEEGFKGRYYQVQAQVGNRKRLLRVMPIRDTNGDHSFVIILLTPLEQQHVDHFREIIDNMEELEQDETLDHLVRAHLSKSRTKSKKPGTL